MAADLWLCLDGGKWGNFRDLDDLTMFADYRLPQILQAMDILGLDRQLQERLNASELLGVHEEDVIELRGCSIHAVELLKGEIRMLDETANVNSVIIDFYLWDLVKAQPN